MQKLQGQIQGNDAVKSVTFLGSPTYTQGGDLMNKFNAGGAGTYTRRGNENIWTKQDGSTVTCPTCNGTGVVSR